MGLYAQTITYANFSASLSGNFHAALANQASFNLGLTTIVGNGVVWDATGLTQQAGTPTISLQYGNPSSTPNAALFPLSNYVFYDPALVALITTEYLNISADSIVTVGQYEPNSAHEIFTNPDKFLIFPFSFNQSFIDNYAKNNYSDATTFSSFQTGTRTVTYAGYGTLNLPQASFSNVALISEIRTNSLGPNSTTYTWLDINTGKKLLYYHENNGNINIAYNVDLNTSSFEAKLDKNIQIYPNPATNLITIKNRPANCKIDIYNTIGEVVSTHLFENNIDISTLKNGIYYLKISTTKQNFDFIKFVKM